MGDAVGERAEAPAARRRRDRSAARSAAWSSPPRGGAADGAGGGGSSAWMATRGLRTAHARTMWRVLSVEAPAATGEGISMRYKSTE